MPLNNLEFHIAQDGFILESILGYDAENSVASDVMTHHDYVGTPSEIAKQISEERHTVVTLVDGDDEKAQPILMYINGWKYIPYDADLGWAVDVLSSMVTVGQIDSEPEHERLAKIIQSVVGK